MIIIGQRRNWYKGSATDIRAMATITIHTAEVTLAIVIVFGQLGFLVVYKNNKEKIK